MAVVSTSVVGTSRSAFSAPERVAYVPAAPPESGATSILPVYAAVALMVCSRALFGAEGPASVRVFPDQPEVHGEHPLARLIRPQRQRVARLRPAAHVA